MPGLAAGRVATQLALLLMFSACIAFAQGSGRNAPQAPAVKNPHGDITIPCENCHTYTSWKPIRRIPEFDHNKTSYPLRGMHEKVECTECHVKLVFSDVGTKCADCHADIHRRQMGANCEQCHTVQGWDVSTQAIQNHQNRFPLIGAHAAVDCDSCHKGAATGQFQGLSTQCYSCHAKDYQSTTNPNHLAGQFSTDCQTCHSVNSWVGATFDHSLTGFPLTGAHVNVACASCHVNNNYSLTSANTACSACHMPDFQSTTNPDHVTGGFATTCQTCHTTISWQPATFDHNATGFPLTGAHVSVACASCHVNNNYNLTAANAVCSACHLTDYQNTTNPNHIQTGIPNTCQVCHTTSAWQPATFDHNQTGFPLTGAHVNVSCASCHVNNNYNLTSASAACSACHMPDYQSTTSPNHVLAAFPTACQTCHTTSVWQPASFDHSTTGFALTGAHVSVTCTACHVNNNYNLTAANTACESCHMNDYNTATSPVNHIQAGFPATCATCHDTTAWTDGTFNHATTGWTLTGAHVTVACTACHLNNNYTLTSANTACSACHMTDYQQTTNPSHAAAAFPTDCSVCHSTTAWTGAAFNHATTGFTLTGTHLTVACTSCHVNNNYSLTAANTACISCHQTDFNNALTPVSHAGFPTTCDLCHDTTAWTDATFNHNSTTFPLTGAHTTVACANCHVNNNYTTLPTTCYGCHQTDYTGTTNPNHAAAGFPTTCQTCHTTTAWTGATFNHTWFPENHGNAQSVCSTCHTNPNDFTVFQCTGCHGGGNSANFSHPRVSNYVYNSTNCYQCHPTGNGG